MGASSTAGLFLRSCSLVRLNSTLSAPARTVSRCGHVYPTARKVRGHSYSTLGREAALKDLLRVSEEVTDALATNKPVVALESTIYTHGAIAQDLELEAIIRRHGAVPAVVGILEGVPTVGLELDEVARLCEGSPKKVSRRDIAYLVGMGKLGHKLNGGTTIAGTMILARLAGIRVFGTGGLGGVHRDGQNTMDVSADLTELGRTRMAVISSGCKGFLDIPRTLEFLETQGVVVSTFRDNQQGDVNFPAFWARDSGVKSPSVVDTEEEAAAMILAQEQLGIESGILFANPIPEEFSIPREQMDLIIEQAVSEAVQQGKLGAANTPFVLSRIRELSEGRSVPANVALVQANVARAAKIAVAISKLIAGESSVVNQYKPRVVESITVTAKGINKASAQVSGPAEILVAGSVALDWSADYLGQDASGSPSPQLHTSNPAHINQSIGGVGRNVALAAHRAGGPSKVKLCSMVGNDMAGSTILNSLVSTGLDTSCIQQLGEDSPINGRTAQYMAVNDANKNLVLAMADMDIFSSHCDTSHWESVISENQPKWVVVDGNWKDSDIKNWIEAAKRTGAHVAFEPVSVAKSARLFSSPGLSTFPQQTVDLAAPNQYELAAMHAAAQDKGYTENPDWFDVIDAFGMRGSRDRFVKLTSAAMTDEGIPQQMVQLLPYIPTIVTKVGDRGVLLAGILRKDDPRILDRASDPYILSRSFHDHPAIGGVYMRLFPPVAKVEDAVSVNGVGDTFLGVLIAGLSRGGKIENLIDVAQKGAVMTLRSSQSVSEDLGALEGELSRAVSRR